MRRQWLVMICIGVMLLSACGQDIPTATPTATATPTLAVTREWDVEAIEVNGQTVTVRLHVFAGVDVWATLGGREHDRLDADVPNLEFIFDGVTPGTHVVEVEDVVGFSETAEVVVPGMIPAGWSPIEVPTADVRFSLSLPAGWQHNELQGIDSMVGEIVGEGVRLYYDYGWYSSHLVADDDPKHTVTYETIDDRRAKLVRPMDASTADGQGIVGVYFEEFDLLEADQSGGITLANRLQVSGVGLSPDLWDTAYTVFRSIRGPASADGS